MKNNYLLEKKDRGFVFQSKRSIIDLMLRYEEALPKKELIKMFELGTKGWLELSKSNDIKIKERDVKYFQIMEQAYSTINAFCKLMHNDCYKCYLNHKLGGCNDTCTVYMHYKSFKEEKDLKAKQVAAKSIYIVHLHQLAMLKTELEHGI